MEEVSYSSLLPYMKPLYGNCWLRISLTSQDTTVLEHGLYPFSIVDDSDPLIRLLEAEFATDAGNTLKRVFLLAQKDHYQIRKEALWPLCNRDIDDSWDKAFAHYSGRGDHYPFMVISGQTDRGGKLSRFGPLFFCIFRSLFFHPPCPRCGSSLRLCENDDLLMREGLQPYSRSLKRYLFCPLCSSSVRPEYYVYERDYSDIPTLKDRGALVRDFRLLSGKEGLDEHFPCAQCSRQSECYGSEDLALSRIVPFSFYPFYLFIFDAMSVHATDFLSLVSGASFDELETVMAKSGQTGRLHHLKAIKRDGPGHNSFLFARDDRYFLEVLYIKVTFLEEVLQKILQNIDPYMHPALRPSLDRMWVKISDIGGLLPLFWNFSIAVMNVPGSPLETEVSPSAPLRYDLFTVGLIWLSALVSNSRQDTREILGFLREVSANPSSIDNPLSELLPRGKEGSPFRPENIFWNPEGKTVKEIWYPLWERSVRLGWSLIETSFLRESRWSKEEYLEQVDKLREEIRGALFSEGLSDSRAMLAPDNEAISKILVKMLERWDASTKAAGGETDELRETIIIDSKQGGDLISSYPQAKDAQGEEFLTETVILGPDGISDQVKVPARSGSEEVKPPQGIPTSQEKEKPSHSDDPLAETVLIAPTRIRDKTGRGGDMSSNAIGYETMADEIRMIYRADPVTAEHAIENYIVQRFKDRPVSERALLLKQLLDQFTVRGEGPGTRQGAHPELGDLSRLLSLVLGEKTSAVDLSSPELMEKVTSSLNLLFDTLNEIIAVINSTLMGEKIELKTIRHIIGSGLGREDDTSSLQTYLDRIRKAFLIAHKAFQQTAQEKIHAILSELDPDHIAAGTDAGLRFGPLRKAELFDVYRERFQACKKWLESGRLMEEFLREFEKICQKAYTIEAGRIQ